MRAISILSKLEKSNEEEDNSIIVIDYKIKDSLAVLEGQGY